MYYLQNRPWFCQYDKNISSQIPEVTLYNLLEQTITKYEEKIAIIFEDKEITYKELKSQVDRLASGWKQLGMQKGEKIGLMLANHPHYVTCYYAAQAIGLTVVQINPMYTPRELLHMVYDSQMKYIVGDSLAKNTIIEVNALQEFKYIFSFDCIGHFKSIEELISNSKPIQEPIETMVHEDVAVIQYTSGTTGRTKGAMLTHYNLVANVVQNHIMYGDNMKFGGVMAMTITPLYHVYGMTSGMNLPIYLGGTILLFKGFKIEYILEKIIKYRPTFFPGVPKMYLSFLNHPKIEQFGLNCLEFCSCGSAPLPVEVLKRFEELTGTVIVEGYGLSETSPSTHRNPVSGLRKVGSIGIPMPWTDSKIVDEYKNEVEINTVGELLIKGPQVMQGYWNNEEETKQALQSDWLYTGDLARMDEDGYFYIVGRKKEMIIVGGFNIYPSEVEDVLYEHPDVLEAAVVGIPDEEYVEIVKAYIVPKVGKNLDPQVMRAYCKTKLTNYKVPRVIEIRKSLPRNTIGKVLKRLLVEGENNKR